MSASKNLWSLLAGASARRPRGAAVTDTSGTWTYEELAAHARAFAGWLPRRGTRPGDRVLLTVHSSRRAMAMIYGCALAGMTAVPLNPAMTEFHRGHVTDDTGARLDLREPATFWPEVEQLVGLGPNRPAASVDPALLLYTSGSTGMPKAIACPATSIHFATCAIQARLGYRPDDVVFCRVPLSFDYGLYQAFLCALAGAELVLAQPGGEARLLTDIIRCGATVVPLVPSLAAMIVRLAARGGEAAKVRLFTNTGEHLPDALIAQLRHRFPGAGVQVMYGTTECKRITIMEVDGERSRPGSVGRPLAGTEVEVVDDQGQPVAPGAAGEIVVRGPHVMAGYWRDPDLTERTFRRRADGGVTLHTGDYGHLDEDGYLYFCSRRDDIFKRNGTRTSSTEIETATRDVPGVLDAVVLPPAADRDAVLCFVGAMQPEELVPELRARLEANKIPGVLRRFESFPLTAHEKVDRRQVRALVGRETVDHRG